MGLHIIQWPLVHKEEGRLYIILIAAAAAGIYSVTIFVGLLYGLVKNVSCKLR